MGAATSLLRRGIRRGWLAGLVALPAVLATQGWALDQAKTLSQFNCRNWSRQNGLPVEKISALTQTPDGNLWLGTQDGLVRFDGLEFKQFRIDLPRVEGQDIRQLTTSRDGQLLFAINQGGFGSFDGQRYAPIGDERWSQPGMGALSLLLARDGSLWTAADLGVGRWSETNPAVRFFGATNAGLVTAFCEDANGRIWLGTGEQGLFYFENGKFEPNPEAPLKGRMIQALAMDGENQLWVGTQSGLQCYLNDQIREIPPLVANVSALLVDRGGVLWVGTEGGGLVRYENGRFVSLRKADGLVSDNVNALFEDAEGSLWVGTRDGLSQLTDVKFPVYSAAHGIGAGSCRAVAAAKGGGLWAATDNGVSYFNFQSATLYQAETLVPNRYFKLCFETRTGDLFTEDGDKILRVFTDNQLVASTTNTQWISAVAEDADSVLLARGGEDALFRWRAGELEPYHYLTGPPPNYYWINNLYTARNGTLWVASKNGIFQLQAGEVRHWGSTNGLSGDLANCLCEGDEGSLWAGLATGVARIKNGQIKNVTMEDGLPDNWIFAMVPDDFGYFWCDSGRGIFRVRRQDLEDFADGRQPHVRCELFDGLAAVQSTARTDQEYSGCKTEDGCIWFPRPLGVVRIDPAHIATNSVMPPVRIDRVLANGRDCGSGGPIIVPPGPGELEFTFSGLSLIAPERVRFRYQLEGFDDHWVTMEGRRQAFYTNLKPGRYTFRVKAANVDGVWNEVGASLQVELRPHFYQTLGFDGLCGGLATALLASLYWWRVRHLERKQRALQGARNALESEVRHRTAELATANARLQAEMDERSQAEEALRQAQKMEAVGRLAGGIAHDFNNLLTVIRGYVECLMLDLQPTGVVGEALREIDAAAARAAKLTAQLLMFSRKKQLQPEHLDLNTLLEPLGSLLRRLLGEDIAVEIQTCASPLPLHADRVMLEMVLLNLALNARDAMPRGGRLTFRTERCELTSPEQRALAGAPTGWFARLEVEDTGSGIAPEVLPHLFEPFFTTKDIGKGTGLGLASAHGIVKQHRGWIEVASQPGCGARFSLFLPLAPAPVAEIRPPTPAVREAIGHETILLVEDDRALRQLTSNLLLRHGYRVLEATTGAEALSLWRQHEAEIHLVVTDMVMPGGISGWELGERLREQQPGVRIIYTSGYSREALEQNQQLQAGINFLAKPYPADQLLQTLRQALEPARPAGTARCPEEAARR